MSKYMCKNKTSKNQVNMFPLEARNYTEVGLEICTKTEYEEAMIKSLLKGFLKTQTLKGNE